MWWYYYTVRTPGAETCPPPPHRAAAEFLKGLTDEQKEEVLHAIVAEVLAIGPKSGVIALHPRGGELMAHIPTLVGRKQLLDGGGWRWLPEILIPVVHDECDRPNGITAEELWVPIDAEDAARDAGPKSRAAG